MPEAGVGIWPTDTCTLHLTNFFNFFYFIKNTFYFRIVLWNSDRIFIFYLPEMIVGEGGNNDGE